VPDLQANRQFLNFHFEQLSRKGRAGPF